MNLGGPLLGDINFCYKTASIWYTVGLIFFVLKIVVPLIIIIIGIVNFAQAIMSNDDKVISKKGASLLKKLVIGIVIFFIPTIVSAIFNMFSMFVDFSADFKICFNCLTNPYKDCDTSYKGDIIPTPPDESYDNDETKPDIDWDNVKDPSAVPDANKGELNIDLDNDGHPDLNIDPNNDGVCDINCDDNRDNLCDYNCIFNQNKVNKIVDADTNGDGVCDVNCDLNRDHRPDQNIDFDGNRKATFNILQEDGTLKNAINQDLDNDGICDVNCDSDNDNWPDTNIDFDGDGVVDLNKDINNDGYPDLNIDINANGGCDVNCDINNDGICDRSCLTPNTGN